MHIRLRTLLHGAPPINLDQIPFDATQPPGSRDRLTVIPCQRWWCSPAVELPRICLDCCNTKAPGSDRCRSCTRDQKRRDTERAEWITGLYEKRTDAAIADDLALVLRIDDTLECVYDMHADNRMTCYQCQTWSDGHAHHPITNEILTAEQWAAYTAARPGIYGRR